MCLKSAVYVKITLTCHPTAVFQEHQTSRPRGEWVVMNLQSLPSSIPSSSSVSDKFNFNPVPLVYQQSPFWQAGRQTSRGKEVVWTSDEISPPDKAQEGPATMASSVLMDFFYLARLPLLIGFWRHSWGWAERGLKEVSPPPILVLEEGQKAEPNCPLGQEPLGTHVPVQ